MRRANNDLQGEVERLSKELSETDEMVMRLKVDIVRLEEELRGEKKGRRKAEGELSKERELRVDSEALNENLRGEIMRMRKEWDAEHEALAAAAEWAKRRAVEGGWHQDDGVDFETMQAYLMGSAQSWVSSLELSKELLRGDMLRMRVEWDEEREEVRRTLGMSAGRGGVVGEKKPPGGVGDGEQEEALLEGGEDGEGERKAGDERDVVMRLRDDNFLRDVARHAEDSRHQVDETKAMATKKVMDAEQHEQEEVARLQKEKEEEVMRLEAEHKAALESISAEGTSRSDARFTTLGMRIYYIFVHFLLFAIRSHASSRNSPSRGGLLCRVR